MKSFLFIFIFSCGLSSFAEDKVVLSSNDETVYKSVQEIENFSKKKLTKRDLEEVKKNLRTLLEIDDKDPSREGVIILSESYNKNKALYDKALKSIETKKNKAKLKEIKSLLQSHYSEGNG